MACVAAGAMVGCSVFAACVTFGSMEVGATDGGTDAPLDGGAKDTSFDDGSPDVPQEEAGACDSVLLAGSRVVEGPAMGTDFVPPTWINAFSFVAEMSGLARCVHIYLPEAEIGSVNLGVYETVMLNGATLPNKLLARASITTMKSGWNVAPLTPAVPIEKDKVVWIALSPTQVDIHDRALNSEERCKGRFLQTMPTNNGHMADIFVPANDRHAWCDLAAFLGP